jgi:predicted metal-dependent phosphoesterase TrpH
MMRHHTRLMAERPTFDLQSHSVHSDGELAPEGVVQAAVAAGVELMALTDHDSIDGLDEAIAAADRLGIGIVPASELSAVHDSYEDLHVLGYRVDHHDPTLLGRLQEARDDRVTRADGMAVKLRELGWAVDDEALETRRQSGKTVGRPHLAGAVVSHPDNAERLRAEGLEDISKFIPAFLIPGTPAYLPRTRPTVPEAIGWIHDAGGVAIWAHPFWDIKDSDTVLATIDRFVAAGIDGVECFYATHTEEQTRLIVARCDELGLLTTGSSDFHGPSHKLFSKFRAFELYDLEPVLGRIAPH